MNKPLWNHQVHGIRTAEVVKDLGLFYDMGTGKTRTMIEIIRRQYAKRNRLMRTLILAPIKVCPNWKDEFGKFSKINPRDVLVLTGTGRQRVRQFVTKVGENLEGSCIVVTNYQSMEMKDFYDLLLKWRPEIVVCDESQNLKNPQSKRAKALVSITDKTEHNYILTGTPILNSAMDLFMQFRVLDRGETFGKNFFAFRGKYFEDENRNMPKLAHFPKWVPRMDADVDLQARVRSKTLRVMKQDCLDLPPFVRQLVYAELSPEQARAYREMHNDFITWINSKHDEPTPVVANLAIVKALRLQQIVTGFVNDEMGVAHRLPCPRLKVLGELLEELTPGHKVIVWANFRENYAMIRELLESMKIPFAEVHGEVAEKQAQSNLKAFREDPAVRVMLSNQSSGGVGINMIEASYSIYYSKNFKLGDDLQSEARNYRGGSEMHTKVTRIDIVTPGTIDEVVTDALAKKLQISDLILNWKEEICLK